MPLALDHLVVAARTLAEGVDWCEATLGLRPEAGGRHAFMGTHNRVFAVTSPMFPRAYLELIAIDPQAPEPGRARWFDLDDAALRSALSQRGPQLVHWVARCGDIAAAQAEMRAAGVDPGEVEHAERATPQGLLQWQISLRADGRRPLAGAAPSLIEWGVAHPTDAMPDSGIALQSMRLRGWPDALAALLPSAISYAAVGAVDAPLTAVLRTSRGLVTLESARPNTR